MVAGGEGARPAWPATASDGWPAVPDPACLAAAPPVSAGSLSCCLVCSSLAAAAEMACSSALSWVLSLASSCLLSLMVCCCSLIWDCMAPSCWLAAGPWPARTTDKQRAGQQADATGFGEITSHPRMGKDYFRIIRGLPVISGGTGRPIRSAWWGQIGQFAAFSHFGLATEIDERNRQIGGRWA